MKSSGKKRKAVVFTELIDSRINGYAIGVSFLIISLFLLFNDTYLHYKVVTYIVGALFGLFGIAGLGTGLDKSKRFKGIGNLVLGLIFLGIWLAAFLVSGREVLWNTLTMPALML